MTRVSVSNHYHVFTIPAKGVRRVLDRSLTILLTATSNLEASVVKLVCTVRKPLGARRRPELTCRCQTLTNLRELFGEVFTWVHPMTVC